MITRAHLKNAARTSVRIFEMRSRPGSAVLLSVLIATLAAGAPGCAIKVRPYSFEGPMWRDDGDFDPFLPMPEEYFSPFAWDAADNMVFRPLARVFAVDPAGEAINVNSMDEVPDSSWFTNRLSRERIPVERIVQAACEGPVIDPSGQWTVTSAKPDGANPGFIIKDQNGVAYLLKFDSQVQPERATAADVVGSIIYWAAGYYAPCNRVVYFDRDNLTIGEGATATRYGVKVPLTWEMLAPIWELAIQREDGAWRATASRFLPGVPLGPWRYESVRKDDANDVVPHQDRRELRGAYVLASWVNHFDSREQNSLSMWIETEGDGAGYVRHNYIDFGDSFGSIWNIRGMSERHGHTYYLDMPYLLQDLVTFGGIPRPWWDNQLGPAGQVLGYFNVETFKPDKYRTGYQNPAFIRATERDKAWMARIIASFPPEAVVAAVKEGRFQNKLAESELIRILLGRREKILARWFRKLSPLTHPRLHEASEQTELCLRDLAVSTGIVDQLSRVYVQRGWRLTKRRRLREVEVGPPIQRADAIVCVGLPHVDWASIESPAYLIVDVNARYSPDDKKTRPARVHLYQYGERAYRIVGLQRPYDLKEPNGRNQHYPRSAETLRID